VDSRTVLLRIYRTVLDAIVELRSTHAQYLWEDGQARSGVGLVTVARVTLACGPERREVNVR